MSKKLLFLLLTAAVLGCETDSYEKGTGENSLLQADFVEVHVNGSGIADYVVTDDDMQLPLSEPLHASWMTKGDTVYRAEFYYRKVANWASPVSLRQMSMASIIHKDSLKNGMKTDPLTLESIWLSKNKRYLNMGFYVKSGSTDKSKSHLLGVVADTLMANTDGSHTLWLTLYHDQAGVPEYYSVHGYFSVATKELTADSVRFAVETYQGQKVKTIALQ